MSTWNEYDSVLARERARERFARAQQRFEELVALMKAGAQPLWPCWRKIFCGDPMKD